MMPSRRTEAGVSRPKQKPTKQVGMMQFILVGAGIIVVIVVALLLFGGGGNKAAKPRSRMASAEGDSAGRPRTSTRRSARVARSSRSDRRAQRREERQQRRQEPRVSGGRTSRSSGGGYTSGGARAASSPNQLRAILTDNAGSRLALVGERRLKVGDDVEGRRIVEVTAEGVKVEYRQNTYTVRVGQKVY
jgi:sRNA-binding protein